MPSDGAPRISVVTATYNRRALLPRLYASLRAQTLQAFEWIVVDDGSTDGTEALVRGWAREAGFPIVYRWQPNQGKHVALNRAVALARAPLTAIIDSDDAYLPHALERLLALWETIPPAQRPGFAGVEARGRLPDGRLVGAPAAVPVRDSDYFEIWAWHGADGDTVGMHRTDVLRAYPFPEDAVGALVPESLVWHRIALRYRTRFVEEVLSVKEYQPEGLSARPLSAWIRDAPVQRRWWGELLAMPRPMPRALRLRAGANYVRYALHAGAGPRAIWRDAGRRRVLLATAPLGLALYLADHVRVARERG